MHRPSAAGIVNCLCLPVLFYLMTGRSSYKCRVDCFNIQIYIYISYNVQAEKKKVTNPFTTKVYEYNLTEATERDWERFSAMLESVSRDFEEETKNENADIKLAKVYE